MITAPLPYNEEQRLRELNKYNVLYSSSEQDFDDIVALASQICNKPISLISLLSYDKQWFKAKVGLNDEETSRDTAFCAHAILQDDIMIVNDARQDERFVDNPYVTGNPNIRFYAGMPIITPSGHKLGTLCVIDNKPGDLTEDQKFALVTLSRQITNLLELRLTKQKVLNLLVKTATDNEKLLDANNLQTQIFSIISHDLRGPLGSIEGIFDLLKNGTMPIEEFYNIKEDIASQIKSVNFLLENLLSWAKSRNNGVLFQPERINISDKVKEVLNLLHFSADLKKITLNNSVPNDVYAYADTDMISLILRNLLSNAIKFTPNGGRIEVTPEKENDYIKISVADSGKGISEKNLQAILQEKGFSSYGTSGEKGTGLGLQLSREFVRKNGGRLTFRNRKSGGAVFSFTIPAYKK